VKQLDETDNIKNGEYPGYPKLLDAEKRSKVLAEALNNTYPDLSITSRMVRGNLQKLGYHIAVSCPVFLLKKQTMICWVAW
ncbi:1688_t:CDS:2, partial [Racocetra fulgida]